jgi:hypothetical protein
MPIKHIPMQNGQASNVEAVTLMVIQDAGRKGVTRRDLERKIADFKRSGQDGQEQILSALEGKKQIQFVRIIDTDKTRGRKRLAWVACDQEAYQ